MIKDTTKEAAGAAEALLFDDWFDAIEDGRSGLACAASSRTMLEAELSEALSRPSHATAGADWRRTRRRHRSWACATGIASGP